MKLIKFLFLVVILGFSTFAYAQQGKYHITGKVLDENTSEPLPYVSVALMRTNDSTIIDGGITTDAGVFNIQNRTNGKYILRCSFVGYKDLYKDIEVKNSSLDIGIVKLASTAETLEAVTVVGAKQMMEYKLDKRVINVDQNLVSTGGDASDVLEDVPSVEVDDEGNISLRGASNVTLLIDGKPSTMYGNDVATVLAQIPASQIDKVEVITNPSAKYNPEGMSGIINITLKEKGNMGFNGNVNISAGTPLKEWMPKERLSTSLNWSNSKFSLSASIDVDYNKRAMLSDNLRFMKGANGGTTDLIRTKRDGGENGWGGGARLGGEWYINKYNTLSLSFNTHYHNTDNDYSTTRNQNLLHPDVADDRNNIDKSRGDNDGTFNNIGFTYQKEFKDRKDQLFYVSGTWNWGKFTRNTMDKITYDNAGEIYRGSTITNYMRGDTSESNNHRAVVDVHYVHPFSEKSQLEIGYNLNYNESSSTSITSYDTNGNKTRNLIESYDFDREEFIHALYATYGFQIGKFSAQLGLRKEFVNNDFTKTDFSGEKISFDKDYNPWYPTLHVSYQVNQMNSFQVSYSRRIRRPDPWTMMPNIDRSNKEYLRFGNPNIDPEYTNAFELGWSLMFHKTTIFTSAYYRQVSNGMTRFQFLWNEENARYYDFLWAWASASNEGENVTAQTFVNLAHSSNYGLEVIVDRDITDWWKANLSMNFYGSYQDGSALNYDKTTSFNFDAKLNTTITLPKNFTIQVSGRYYAPRKNIQGRDNARYDVDLAIRKSLWNKQANIGLNFRDVFDSRGGFGYAYTDQYVSFTKRHPYSRSIRLSFSYNFGKTANMKRNKVKPQQSSGSDYTGGSGENYDE